LAVIPKYKICMVAIVLYTPIINKPLPPPPPPVEAKVHNVALALKRLDTPVIDHLAYDGKLY